MSSPEPANKALYNKVKAEAKKKFDVWPSAYASGWLVKEYKRRGGKYTTKKSNKKTGLEKWFAEEWIDVCYYPKKVPCGRPKGGYSGNYPYCRPSKRVNKSTPKTAGELTAAERRRRCQKKRSNPRRRVSPKKSKRKSPKKKSRKRRSKSPKKKSRKRRSKSPKKKSRKR